MAKTITVSGGGNALADAVATATYNDTIYVEPGIYDPIAPKTKMSIIGTDPNRTAIIDGGGTRRCIANTYGTNYYTTVLTSWNQASSFSSVRYRNITFQNGRSEFLSAQNYWREAVTRNAALIDCNILSCETSANFGYEAVGEYAILYGTTCLNCYFDRCTGLSASLLAYTTFNECEFTNWYNPRNILPFFMARKTHFHHNRGRGRGIGGQLQECIVNDCLFGTEALYRSRTWNSTFVNNNCTTYFWNDNGGASQNIDNCIFFNNALQSTRPLINNYESSSTATRIRNNVTDIPESRLARLTSTTTSAEFVISGNTCGVTDIKFLDLSAGDFHLSAGSPAIGAGNYSIKLLGTDFEGKLWKDPPAAGAYEYYSPAQNLPNRTYPLGREREHLGMIYDAELTYLSGPGYANFQLPMSVYDYRTSFEIKSSCGHSSSNQNRWGFDVTQSKIRYTAGLWNNGWDNIYLGGYEVIGGKTSYGGNDPYTYSFDADNLSGKIILSNGTVNTFTTSLKSGFSATWSATNINYSFFGMSSTYWRNPSIFYYAKFWNSDGMIADVIPVRVGNAGYLFDKVKGRMLTKYPIGTNIQFIKGPDK